MKFQKLARITLTEILANFLTQTNFISAKIFSPETFILQHAYVLPHLIGGKPSPHSKHILTMFACKRKIM